MLDEIQRSIRSSWALWKLYKTLDKVDIEPSKREEIIQKYKKSIGW